MTELKSTEREEFRINFGLNKNSIKKIIKKCYEKLNFITFFTVGKDEVRAWTIKKGMKASQAAKTIHSDMEKGFIKAEIIHYNDFLKLKSIATAKKLGLCKLVGKDYIIKDGEIIQIKFNI